VFKSVLGLGLLVIIVRFRGNDLYLILENFKIKLLVDNFYLV